MPKGIDLGGFVKLYGKMVCQSSLLECDPVTRWVFVYMLSQADEDGFFRCATVKNLALAARVSEEQAKKAIAELEAPDPDSTSRNCQGRRILSRSGGWRIATYKKYREFRSRRQVIDAERQRRKRDRDMSRMSRSVTARHAQKKKEILEADLDLDPSTEEEEVYWNPKNRNLESSGQFQMAVLAKYRNAPSGWVEERWAKASLWLGDNPQRLRELLEGHKLLAWIENWLRDDFAKLTTAEIRRSNEVRREVNAGGRG